MDCYSQSNQPDKLAGAAGRLLQVDPNNIQAIFASVFVKKQQCTKSVDASGVATDAQSCDDAGTLSQKGLTVPKPASMSDADWKSLTGNYYPVFDSSIALDDAVSKKDFKGAQDEYSKELMLYPPAACTQPGACLVDTLQLAQAFAKPGDSRDPVKAVWFYARAWDYAPQGFKAQIETQLEYWYKRYHGTLDGDAAIKQQIDGIKSQAQATLFPPDGFKIDPAPSNQDLANKYCAVSNDDLKKLALEDKEFILANASKDCTDKLWPLMKDQDTPVPGIVIADNATVLKISATMAAAPTKPKDFIVKLNTPGPCAGIPPAPSELKIKDAQAYILANGDKADTDAVGDVLTDPATKIHKLSVEPAIAVFNMAVTQDAKECTRCRLHRGGRAGGLRQGHTCCRFRAEIPARHGAGRNLRLLHAHSRSGHHGGLGADRSARRLQSGAGEEGRAGPSPRCQAFGSASRAVDGSATNRPAPFAG